MTLAAKMLFSNLLPQISKLNRIQCRHFRNQFRTQEPFLAPILSIYSVGEYIGYFWGCLGTFRVLWVLLGVLWVFFSPEFQRGWDSWPAPSSPARPRTGSSQTPAPASEVGSAKMPSGSVSVSGKAARIPESWDLQKEHLESLIFVHKS